MNRELLAVRGNLSKAMKYDAHYLADAREAAVNYMTNLNPNVEWSDVSNKQLLKFLDNHMYGKETM